MAFNAGFGTGFIEANARSSGDLQLKQRYSAGAGFNVGHAGFTVGAGFLWDNQGLQGPNNRYDTSAGVTYGAGPWLIGVNFGYAWVHDRRNLVGTVYQRRSNDGLIFGELGAAYTLGPGIKAFTALNLGIFGGNDTATEESTGIAWSSGLALTF